VSLRIPHFSRNFFPRLRLTCFCPLLPCGSHSCPRLLAPSFFPFLPALGCLNHVSTPHHHSVVPLPPPPTDTAHAPPAVYPTPFILSWARDVPLLIAPPVPDFRFFLPCLMTSLTSTVSFTVCLGRQRSVGDFSYSLFSPALFSPLPPLRGVALLHNAYFFY